MKRIFRYILIAGLGNLLFLFSPNHFCDDPRAPCIFSFMPVVAGAEANLSWDSFEFLNSAREPSRILQEGHLRQSRPVFVWMGAVMGRLVWYLSVPLHPGQVAIPGLPAEAAGAAEPAEQATPGTAITDSSPVPGIPRPDAGQHLARACFLIGFILINLLVLVIACWLFEELLRLHECYPPRWLLNGMLFLLTVNQLTKLFIWSAHTQMFAIMVPLLCLYACTRIARERLSLRAFTIIALAAGTGLLIYGNFLLLLPSAVLGLWQNKQLLTRQKWRMGLAGFVVFTLPTAAWSGYLYSRGVILHNEEIVKYREFIWVIDSWKVSPAAMFRQAWTNAGHLAGTGWILTGMAALVLTWLVVRRAPDPLQEDPTAATGVQRVSHADPGLTRTFLRLRLLPLFLLTLCFIWGIGAYADRITFGLVPFFLVCICMDLAHNPPAAWRKWLLIAVIAGCWFWTWLFNLPHFGPYYYI